MNVNLREMKEITNRNFLFYKDLRVSKNSIFSDQLWDFCDSTKKRLNSVDPAKKRLDWTKYNDIIHPDIIHSIKIVCFFFIKSPKLISTRIRTKQNGLKPNTIVQNFTVFLAFIKEICFESTIELMLGGSQCYLSNFGDIDLIDLKQGFIKQKNIYHNSIKQILKAFCNPIIQNYLNCKINWTTADIGNIKKNNEIKQNKDTFSDQPIDDKLFIFLTKQATTDIQSFLKLMSIPVNLPLKNDFEIEKEYKKYTTEFKEMFECYVNLRLLDREIGIKKGKRCTEAQSNLRKKFGETYGISIKEFNVVLNRIHKAAIYILIQYTGGRYSDGISFEKDCLKKIKEGLWVIKGTHTKGENINQLEGKDEWVACPIVRDAVRVLEEIQKFTFNRFLISSTFSVYLKQKEIAITNSSVNSILNRYLKEIDKEENFTGNENCISTHRLRHTLARHLLRANLGIPYISYHLKHVHTQIIQMQNAISDITLGYGNISSELVNSATAIKGVIKEIVYDIYHPDSPVAGINSEDFKERRRAYFQGMMAEGFNEEEIMEYIVSKGVPFVDVGLGFCGGKKEIVLENGKKEQPPCIGQLKCNPSRCHNAIIHKSKIPNWIAIYKQHKHMIENPLFEYAKNEYEAFLEEDKRVLTHLGINVEGIE